jgi:hypothetical protein
VYAGVGFFVRHVLGDLARQMSVPRRPPYALAILVLTAVVAGVT